MSQPRRRDLRAEANRILGNRPPAQTDREAYIEAGRRIANLGKASFNATRAAGRRIGDDIAIDLAVTQGQPHFPHNPHVLATILTVGLWSPVYITHWLCSARFRYQRQRRAELRRHGLIG